MENNPPLIDQLDQFVSQMFRACLTLDPKPANYIVLQEPESSDPHWLILVFFENTAVLREAIKNGICYQVHEYMSTNLNNVEQFRPLKKVILFESGVIPQEESALETMFDNIIKKLYTLAQSNDDATTNTCSLCQHDFNAHKMLGQVDEIAGAPTKGWMMCPEEDCTCFRTWSR